MRITDMSGKVGEARAGRRDLLTSFATSAWVVAAPMRIDPPLTEIPFISETCRRSTRSEGAASRCFMVGSRVCPPERYLASSFDEASLTASSTEEAR
jgi:hypothetical protein